MFHCTTINWNSVRSKVKNEAWAKHLFESINADFIETMRIIPATPSLGASKHFHEYFCGQCAALLTFNLESPQKHVCPNCGKIYTGEPYDGAWRDMINAVFVSMLDRAAILANTVEDNTIYIDFVKKTILFYAGNYRGCTLQKLQGKIFTSVLSEAIFVIAIERILRMVAGLNIFSEPEMDTIKEDLFIPAADLIKPQIRAIHNIHLWMQAAVAASASITGDKKSLHDSIYGKYGFMEQLEQGTRADGLWYEISPSYHFYTLSAALSMAWIAKENEIDLFAVPKLKKMSIAPVNLMYKDGMFPAYNDGWYGKNVSDYAYLYEQLSAVYTSEKIFQQILGMCYRNTPLKNNYRFGESRSLHSLPEMIINSDTGFNRNSLNALLYGVNDISPESMPSPQTHFLFEDSGIAILQNETLRVSLKASRHGGGHDHQDKLAIDVFAGDKLISADIGTSGYGSPLTTKWNRASLAHNLVILNQMRQKPSDAELISFGNNHAEYSADNAYEGAKLHRRIELFEKGFQDTFEVQCEESNIVDWVFHCRGKIVSDLNFENAGLFKEENGYDMLTNIKCCSTGKAWNMTWEIDGKLKLRLEFEGQANTQVYIADGMDYDPHNKLQMVIVRRNTGETVFKAKFEVII